MFENLRRAMELMTPQQRRHLPWVLTTMLATAILEFAGVGSIFPFLTLLADPTALHRSAFLSWASAKVGVTDATTFLLLLGGAVIGLITLTLGVSAYARYVLVQFNYELENGLSVRLFRAYLARPYAFFLGRNTADINRNLLLEVGLIIAGIVNPVLSFVSAAFVALAILGYLLFLQPVVTVAIIVVVGGGYAAAHAGFGRWLRRLGERRNRANEDRFRVTNETFGGIKALKARGLEDVAGERIVAPSRDSFRATTKVRIVEALPGYAMRMLTFGGLMMVLLVMLAAGEGTTTVIPLVGVFAFAGYRLMPSLESMFTAYTEFQFREESLRRVHADLRWYEGRAPAEPTQDLPGLARDVRLQGLAFGYEGAATATLDDINIVIPRNTSVGFVGPTGGGKTTLLDLIMGLHRPTKGQLVIDGIAVTEANVRSWQRQVGYVPQDIFLADDTIARNIAFGVPDDEIDHSAVERAARTAHIHDFILNDLPAGYATAIGERGVRLSGGQRQRLGIARALYDDPPVLCFDEATSDIDTVTEAHITEAIREFSGRKTLITVAHRLTTIKGCDVIYIMERGRIVAHGSYAQLVATNPLFQRFVHVNVAEISP